MLLRLYWITKGHYDVALEHIKEHDINHIPTYFQALQTTITDYLFNNVIYDKESKSYLVYEVIHKRTLGLTIALVTSVYVPKEYRGRKIVKKMLDKIPYTTISNKGDEEIERLYICKRVL